jgi:citrate synthase
MAHEYEFRLSSHDETSISVREKDLTSEVMGELSFSGSLYYLWTGTEPTPGEEELLGAMLSGLMVHGVTPSTLVSRLTLFSEPKAVQTAVASAIGGVGSQFIGTMKECSEHLHDVVDAENTDAAVDDLVATLLDRGEQFPGIGHPHLDPVDPRAERLFEMADEADVTGEYTETLRAVQSAFEAETGADLPINVTGAIAALTADMGMSPTAARGIAIVGRATGVVGEVLEEQERPIAGEIWQHVDENAGRSE